MGIIEEPFQIERDKIWLGTTMLYSSKHQQRVGEMLRSCLTMLRESCPSVMRQEISLGKAKIPSKLRALQRRRPMDAAKLCVLQVFVLNHKEINGIAPKKKKKKKKKNGIAPKKKKKKKKKK